MSSSFYKAVYPLISNLKNIPGKRTARKIVAIECDDWGGIRFPSLEVYNNLKTRGLKLTDTCFRYDTLESAQDLKYLIGVLENFRDRNGRPGVMTAISNVANPDFEKIRQNEFSEYFYEPVSKTYSRYFGNTEQLDIWREASEKGIIIPELHGREHISVHHWIEALRKGDQDILEAFNYGVVSAFSRNLSPVLQEFRPQFYFSSDEQIDRLKQSIPDSVRIFREIFGSVPEIFVPGNNMFHPVFEEEIAQSGIRFLYSEWIMNQPVGDGKIGRRYVFPGSLNKYGVRYYTRNCVFEPVAEGYKGVDYTIMQIGNAFRWGKPAIISTHRVNFCGGISLENRQRGLDELGRLINNVLSKWPDAEFMPTKEVLRSLYSKQL